MDSDVTHEGKCDAETGGSIGFAKDDFKKLSKDYLIRNQQKCAELLSINPSVYWWRRDSKRGLNFYVFILYLHWLIIYMWGKITEVSQIFVDLFTKFLK